MGPSNVTIFTERKQFFVMVIFHNPFHDKTFASYQMWQGSLKYGISDDEKIDFILLYKLPYFPKLFCVRHIKNP
jgi:hypothetical protein